MLSNNESEIAIEKISLGESGINYSLPLNNFKLYAKYNPEFFIDTTINEGENKLFYAYGFNEINYAQLISNININYDDKCFTDGFNPDYDGYELKSRRFCQISFKNLPPIYTANNANYISVLGFDLHAEYDSPTENKHVIQYIGHILKH